MTDDRENRGDTVKPGGAKSTWRPMKKVSHQPSLCCACSHQRPPWRENLLPEVLLGRGPHPRGEKKSGRGRLVSPVVVRGKAAYKKRIEQPWGGSLTADSLRSSSSVESVMESESEMDPGHVWYWGDESEVLEAKAQLEVPSSWPKSAKRELLSEQVYRNTRITQVRK